MLADKSIKYGCVHPFVEETGGFKLFFQKICPELVHVTTLIVTLDKKRNLLYILHLNIVCDAAVTYDTSVS